MALAARMMGGGISAAQALAINGDLNTSVSAAGTTQGTATAINAGIVIVTTAAASSGVILPACMPGDEMDILNLGSNAVTIYPDSSSQINAIAVNTGILLATNTAIKLRRFTSTRWMGFLSA